LQQKYATSLLKKREIEGKVQGVMKENNEIEERDVKPLKEKD
jgi:hypothetical protein